MIESQLQPALDEFRQRLSQLYGERLVQMILFGSQARGNATAESDVDVLVVLKGDVNMGDEIERTGDMITDMLLDYGIPIVCIFVSEQRFLHEKNNLFINIKREGIFWI